MPSFSEDQSIQLTIQHSLQDMAVQMKAPISPKNATQLYIEAVDLLNHLDYAPITLARVAGTLLVYQIQQIEPEELAWLKQQIQEATEAEAVEELIESLSRESL